MSEDSSSSMNDMPLLSERSFEIFSDPFAYGYADDFLPAPLYRGLEQGFPSPDGFPNPSQLKYGKKFDSIAMNDSLEERKGLSDEWRRFIGFIRSERFLTDCQSWSRHFVTPYRRPEANSKILKFFGNRPAIRNWTVETDCEFSVLERGASLPAHTDSIDKILVFLLYFPQDEWREEWGGGTQVYQPLDRRYAANWSNSALPRSETDLLFDTGFKANRLFFFAKAANSWHGVMPLSCPEGILRRSFTFNVMIPARLRRGLGFRAKERAIHRIERPRFRQFRSRG